MPLIIEGGRIPPLWAEKTSFRRNGQPLNANTPNCVRVAFINNMPDPALEDTELQFFELLHIASKDIPVFVTLYSIDEVPRSDRGERHLNSFYSRVNDLWNEPVDALIMTGTEPRSANLQEEPYWNRLGQVLDWAEANTVSSILSCLAAHAGVLYSDGISRHRLPDKQFGVFDFAKVSSHHLTASGGARVCFPHSRWNEVRAVELAAGGYQVLTQSVEGGVDCFVKRKKNSLFVHFQGHPEYEAQTLLKEYRRDIKRFLRSERETFPTMPKGYFHAESAKLLRDFRDVAVADRREGMMESFPDAAIAAKLKKTWQASALAIYRNWIHYVVSEKGKILTFPAMAAACTQAPRRRSARP
jgi:homoserine O-succinyltransferase/O-acetyltransferase